MLYEIYLSHALEESSWMYIWLVRISLLCAKD